MAFAGYFASVSALEAIDTLAVDSNGRVAEDNTVVWLAPLEKMFFLDKADTASVSDGVTIISATGNGSAGAGGRWKIYQFDAEKLEGNTLSQVITQAQTGVDAATLNGQSAANIISTSQGNSDAVSFNGLSQSQLVSLVLSGDANSGTVAGDGSQLSGVSGGGGGSVAPIVLADSPITTLRTPVAAGEIVIRQLVRSNAFDGFGAAGANDDPGSQYEVSLKSVYIANSTTPGDYTIAHAGPINIKKIAGGTGNSYLFLSNGVPVDINPIFGVIGAEVDGQLLVIRDDTQFFNSAASSAELGYASYYGNTNSPPDWLLAFDSSGLGIDA